MFNLIFISFLFINTICCVRNKRVAICRLQLLMRLGKEKGPEIFQASY